MKVNEIIIEAAMSPTAFAQSLESAHDQGVLIGFEFEVCVPKDVIVEYANTAYAAAVANPTKTIEKLINLYKTNSEREIPVRLTYITRLDEMFRFKQPINGFASIGAKLTHNIDVEKAKLLPPIKKAFAKLASGTRNKLLTHWKEKLVDEQYKNTELGFLEFLNDISWKLRQYKETRKLGNLIIEYVAYPVQYPPLKIYDALVSLGIDDPAVFVKQVDSDIKVLLNVFGQRSLNDPEDEAGYTDVTSPLKEWLSSVTAANINIFANYHQHTKNLTDWYIEPDGSIEANPGDADAEVVTPPLPVNEAITALKSFYSMAKQHSLYTTIRLGYTLTLVYQLKPTFSN